MNQKPHRSKSQKERDRIRIAEAYLKGVYQVDIAQELGITQATVSNELKKIQAEWHKESLFDFNAAKQKELAKIDLLELTYWDAWEKSKLDKKTVSSKRRISIEIEQTAAAASSSGDPRFLQGIQWCITKRCEILGFDAPTKLEHTGKDGGAININESIDFKKLDDDQLRTIIKIVESVSDTSSKN